MKPLTTLCLLLWTATAFAQQRSLRVDSSATTDNMPVVKGRGHSVNMPIQKKRGDAVDMPTVGVPVPVPSGPHSTTGSKTNSNPRNRDGRFKSDSSARTKSS